MSETRTDKPTDRQSNELFERACRIIPGGVNSPVRAFKAVGGTPPFIVSAHGCRLTDADGREYIDYIGSWGAMIAGHSHPAVVKAIGEAAQRGSSYGMPCPAELRLAEEIITRMPYLEMVRFVNSGTEAVMSALRLARAATGRDIIVKFAGCYHGHCDSLLAQSGSGLATLGLPSSPGVTRGAAQDTRVAGFNDLASVEAIFRAEGSRVAAVIVEPVAANMGVIPPGNGFLEGLRQLCDQYGSLLIFDEVVTGFRVAPGGAQQRYNVKPDLTTLGKIIGGGLPVGAYGGRVDLMKLVAPGGAVYQAGTLSGNPLTMAAGLATLELLSPEAYLQLEEVGKMLEEGLKGVITGTGVPAVVQRVGSMLTVFFATQPQTDFKAVSAVDHNRFAKFFHKMLEQGVHLPPSGYEAWFLSLAHDETVIDQTVEAVRQALNKDKVKVKVETPEF